MLELSGAGVLEDMAHRANAAVQDAWARLPVLLGASKSGILQCASEAEPCKARCSVVAANLRPPCQGGVILIY